MKDDLRPITEDKAARRFHQIAAIERELSNKGSDIAKCKAHLKELNEEHDGLLLRLRAAARNEGELPLFAWDE